MDARQLKFFIDTEFIEDGPDYPIQLLSLGIVCENGTHFYAENKEADLSRASDWVRENVLPHLGKRTNCIGTREDVKKCAAAFIASQCRPTSFSGSVVNEYEPQFWGYFADYDWVLFAQLFGRMIDLPKGYPMYCLDLKQMAYHLGIDRSEFPKQSGNEHDALYDAFWNLKLYEFLKSKIPLAIRG